MLGLPLRVLLNSLSVLGALFALWRGGVAERTAGAIVLANVAVGEVGRFISYEHDAVIRLVNDGATALALLAVTIRFGAPWMGGVMLFFAAQFSMHSYYMVMGRPNDRLHAIINNLDWQGITWCLVIGTVVAWRQRIRRRREAGATAAAEPSN